jgi:putative transport protein
MNYFTLCGLLAGCTTDPPALAFANEQSPNDAPAIAYASVYPLTMFLRVLSAQILIVIALS